MHSQENSEDNKKETTKKNRFFIGIAAFTGIVESDLKENLDIRQNIEPSYYNYYSGLYTVSSMYGISIKPEYRFANNRLGIISGIKYTRSNSNIYGDPHFYFRYRTDGTDTYYAKIDRFAEHYDYIGIPVELRYFAFQYKYIALFIRIGVDFNFKVNSKIDVEFTKESMSNVKDEVLDKIDLNTNSFYSSFYHSVGLRFMKDNGFHINGEIIMPSPFITQDNFAFIDPYMYYGFKISVLMPIKKN